MINYKYVIRYKVQKAYKFKYGHSFAKSLRDANMYATGLPKKHANVYDLEVYKMKNISWFDRLMSHLIRKW